MRIGVAVWPRIPRNYFEYQVQDPSADLLARYVAGDADASESLFSRYVEQLVALVRRHLATSMNRRIDAEDAVQSAYRSFFLKARKGEFTLQHGGDLWKLLATIALNKLHRQIAHHRAGKRAVSRDRPVEAAVAFGRGPSPLEVLATADELKSLMARLTARQRTILELRLQDNTWPEIARQSGCSERTARRAIEEIRTIWHGLSSEDAGSTPTFEENGASISATAEIAASPAERVSPHSETLIPIDYRKLVLEEYLGSGGMGKVYKARLKGSNRLVAVKMLRKSRWTIPGAIGRFLDEARIVARLENRGIVGLHGVGHTPGGGVFIVMDFVDGSNLADVMKSGLPAPHHAVEWIAQAADALEYAHERGIVHCDLKPSNLLLRKDGNILVADFGLATSLSSVGQVSTWAGTWGYMAPEQLDITFGDISPATDCFALGLILIQLLTGNNVFEGKTLLDVLSNRNLDRQWFDLPKREPFSAALGDILADCLAIDSRKRLTSCKRLSKMLGQLAIRMR